MMKIVHVLLSSVLATGACTGASAALAGPDNLVISLEGDCPGTMSVHWQGATPNRRAWLLISAENAGFQSQPGYPCGGTFLDIGPGGLRIAAAFRSGSEGSGRGSGRVTPAVCGQYLQMIVEDGNPCATSNVAQIP